MEFSRQIKFTDNKLDYLENKDDENLYIKKYLYNCHFGSLKLTYSEIEFLVYCSKYVNINECLVVYIGAQPGFRLKKIFIDLLFPKLKFLLYDPMKFDIKEDNNFIIKTDTEGWFDDNKIKEVLKIANGRKILYISDIRIGNEDFMTKESFIYEDMLKQQKWGIMMNAEFMLLKFRMFFYEKSIDEINFINNDKMINDIKNYNIKYKIDDDKQKSINKYMLYLDGKILSQIYQGPTSSETRLLVKKNNNGYKMRYYNNLDYEQILYYFNNNTRLEEYRYKKSYKLEKYLPNYYTNYTSASEYKIIYDYLKYYKKEKDIKFKNVLNIIAAILIILSLKYNNNTIKCIYKNFKYFDIKNKEDVIRKFKNKLKIKLDKQKENIMKCKYYTEDVKKQIITAFKL